MSFCCIKKSNKNYFYGRTCLYNIVQNATPIIHVVKSMHGLAYQTERMAVCGCVFLLWNGLSGGLGTRTGCHGSLGSNVTLPLGTADKG
jgi:hypothetical protein